MPTEIGRRRINQAYGGWPAVFAGRRRGEMEAADQRMLGDGELLNKKRGRILYAAPFFADFPYSSRFYFC